MTDEERKQFINEYCRNVGDIKIRCDDCKFVEDCVDYGWDGCRKFTQKPSESNEEYIRAMSDEDLAIWIYQERCKYSDGWYGEQCGHTVEEVKEWLKEIHQ